MSQWEAAIALIGVIAWWLAPPSSLGDLSRRESLRRQMTSSSIRTLTDRDVLMLEPRALPNAPTSGRVEPATPEARAESESTAPIDRPQEGAAERRDETWWRTRVSGARASLERDQLLFEALQTRINSLANDLASQDDPARRAVLAGQRSRAVAELDRMKKAVDADRQALDDLAEGARKQGVPPAWVR